MNMEYKINGLNETQKLAKNFASTLKKGDVVLLSGDLGAGKTTFTQFVFKELGVKEIVNSPTFAVLKTYNGNGVTLNHFDTYRITTEEAIECGFDEILNDKNCITFIEWADMIAPLIPSKHIDIKISCLTDEKRKFTIERVENE